METAPEVGADHSDLGDCRERAGELRCGASRAGLGVHHGAARLGRPDWARIRGPIGRFLHGHPVSELRGISCFHDREAQFRGNPEHPESCAPLPDASARRYSCFVELDDRKFMR